MTINAMLFGITYETYMGTEFAYLRYIIHEGLPVARGAAMVLNLNCALILLPVCRNLVNFARGCFESKRSIRRLFDKNILFHKWCAYVICVFSCVHISAHFYNINALVISNDYQPTNGLSNEQVLFTSVPGGTGIGITCSLILMVTTASPQIRRSYFELFWYTHHLFVVFYVCLGLHGYSGFIEHQTNYNEYPFSESTGACIQRAQDNTATQGCVGWGSIKTSDLQSNGACLISGVNVGDEPDAGVVCCPCNGAQGAQYGEVLLQKGGPMTWMFIVGPLALYLAERFYRFIMSYTRRLQILKVVKHQDSVPVMEVQFRKVPTKAGQYVFINCPRVSFFEWHPFTLTSCPELDYISLHIRLCGDFTTKLAEQCGFFEDHPVATKDLPWLAIDGPFGTASEDMYRYPVAVLVGAGIGVTPFASLLQALYFRKSAPDRYPKFKTEKVYFYWVCPGFEAWGWFAKLLMDLEEKLAELGESDFLTVRVYMTRGWTKDDAAKIMLQEDEEGDSIIRDAESGRALKHKMNFGRPRWEKEFAEFSANHTGKNVGIFFCGPKILSTELHDNCNKFTATCYSQGTRFYYNKENF